jgi:hypothetical protein
MLHTRVVEVVGGLAIVRLNATDIVRVALGQSLDEFTNGLLKSKR